MQKNKNIVEPDNTAVRTVLWRALHLRVDAEPHIFEDEIGLELVAPSGDWQERPDMKYTKRLRASIVARARFIEDLVIEQSRNGITQYIILGAGLDTFTQRRLSNTSNLHIYEIDLPGTLNWKQKRLTELGYKPPGYLHFVSVDFETSSWRDELLTSGFDILKPAVVSCTGVTLYLTRKAILETLRSISSLAEGSTLAMSFYLPKELLDDEDRPMQEIAEKGARESGTPMISFFTPEEITILASETGFKEAKTITTKDMEQLYFIGRTDHLLPASGEVILVAST